MENFETLHQYLAAHSDEIGERILSSYPALFGAEESPSPLLSQMLRSPYPAQTMAIMGVSRRWDPHAVTRWIKSGHLKAKFRGTARGPQQNGDSYLIQEKDIRRFVLDHPTDIDLRKVDQLWFLDLLTNGLVRAA
jgi:hypothetical protein